MQQRCIQSLVKIYKIEILVNISNFQLLAILAKSSILHVRLASGCASVEIYVVMMHL